MMPVPDPFSLSDEDEDDDYPLNPDFDSDHAGLYVNIDRTREAYEKFTSKIITQKGMKRGKIVLVSGTEGCGKSSVLYRCATWLRALESFAQAGDRQFFLQWVDLTPMLDSTAYSGGGIHDRVKQVANLVVDTIKAGLFDEKAALRYNEIIDGRSQEGEQLNSQVAEGGPLRAYRGLSALLAQSALADKVPTVVAVLLPRSELADELRIYLSLAQPGFIFFMEASIDGMEGDIAAGIRSTPQTQVIKLEIGGLKPGDGWGFVQSRTRNLSLSYPNLPRFEPAIVDNYLAGRLPAGMSIRQLRKAARQAFRVAISREGAIVEDDDFRDDTDGL